jgi:hypothetical protein
VVAVGRPRAQLRPGPVRARELRGDGDHRFQFRLGFVQPAGEHEQRGAQLAQARAAFAAGAGEVHQLQCAPGRPSVLSAERAFEQRFGRPGGQEAAFEEDRRGLRFAHRDQALEDVGAQLRVLGFAIGRVQGGVRASRNRPRREARVEMRSQAPAWPASRATIAGRPVSRGRAGAGGASTRRVARADRSRRSCAAG